MVLNKVHSTGGANIVGKNSKAYRMEQDYQFIDEKLGEKGFIKISSGYSSKGKRDYSKSYNVYRKCNKVSFDNISNDNIIPQNDAFVQMDKSLDWILAKLKNNSDIDLSIGFDTEFVYVDKDGNVLSEDALKEKRIEDVKKKQQSINNHNKNHPRGSVRRMILSYQFVLLKDGYQFSYLFIMKKDSRVEIEQAMAVILDDLNYSGSDRDNYCSYTIRIREKSDDEVKEITIKPSEYKYYENKIAEVYDNNGEWIPYSSIIKKEIIEAAKQQKSKPYKLTIRNTDKKKKPDTIKICLISHFGRADLSAFKVRKNTNLLNYCSEIQGGLATVDKKYFLFVKSVSERNCKNNYGYEICISVADTMMHSVEGKSLADLGEAIGISKVSVVNDVDIESYKSHMQDLLFQYPDIFADYAIRDAEICLMYMSRLYGINKEIPITLLSAGTNIAYSNMLEYYGIDCKDEFDAFYRGYKVSNINTVSKKNKLVKTKKYSGISQEAEEAQAFSTNAYHGGLNASLKLGIFDEKTYDLDLKSAYAVSMCAIQDIDWNNLIKYEIRDREITLEDFMDDKGIINPMTPLMGICEFEFPENVYQPSIPIKKDDSIVYLRSSAGIKDDSIYACGPEIYLALNLGATVRCKKGFIYNRRYTNSGEPSYSMKAAVVPFVNARMEAKNRYEGNSFWEKVLKVMCAGIYGKICQGIKKKTILDAYNDERKPLEASKITNPYFASMITSLVRAVLIATINQLHDSGYNVYSVTTDGLITSAGKDIVDKLDLYGFKDIMLNAYRSIDENAASIWEVKHTQEVLFNVSTRCNIGFNYSFSNNEKVVLAHGGIKSRPVFDRNILQNDMVKSFKESFFEFMDSDEDMDKMGLAEHLNDEIMYSVMDRYHLVHDIVNRQDARVAYSCLQFTSFSDMAIKKEDFLPIYAERKSNVNFDMKRCPIIDDVKDVVFTFDSNDSVTMAVFDTRPFDNIEEYMKYKNQRDRRRLLVSDDYILFDEKLHSYKKIFMECVMGHFSGMWTIPYLSNENITVSQKIEWLNRKGKPYSIIFSKSDWDNLHKKNRQVIRFSEEERAEMLKYLQKK